MTLTGFTITSKNEESYILIFQGILYQVARRSLVDHKINLLNIKELLREMLGETVNFEELPAYDTTSSFLKETYENYTKDPSRVFNAIAAEIRHTLGISLFFEYHTQNEYLKEKIEILLDGKHEGFILDLKPDMFPSSLGFIEATSVVRVIDEEEYIAIRTSKHIRQEHGIHNKIRELWEGSMRVDASNNMEILKKYELTMEKLFLMLEGNQYQTQVKGVLTLIKEIRRLRVAFWSLPTSFFRSKFDILIEYVGILEVDLKEGVDPDEVAEKYMNSLLGINAVLYAGEEIL